MSSNYRWCLEITWVFKTTGGSVVICISHVMIFFNAKHIYLLYFVYKQYFKLIWTHQISLKTILTDQDDSTHWHVQRNSREINAYCVNTTVCISCVNRVTATRTVCGLSKWGLHVMHNRVCDSLGKSNSYLNEIPSHALQNMCGGNTIWHLPFFDLRILITPLVS